MNRNIIIWAIVVVVILWRLYARLRRNVGRQEFRGTRLKYYVVLFAVISLFFAYLSRSGLQLMLGWAGGLALGVLLGLWAFRITRFEASAAGRFYTPNAHIGVALSLLFFGRIVYRVIAVYAQFSVAGRPPPPAGHSALDILTFELLAGYYIAYNGGILRRHAAEDKPPAPVV